MLHRILLSINGSAECPIGNYTHSLAFLQTVCARELVMLSILHVTMYTMCPRNIRW